MTPPSGIVWNLLLDLDLANEAGAGDWPIFAGYLPEETDQALVIVDRAGTDNGRIQATGERIIHPGIQIVCRSQDYMLANTKIREIAAALDAVFRRTVAGEDSGETYIVQNVSRQGDVLSLGLEDEAQSSRRRFLFSFNAVLTYNQA